MKKEFNLSEKIEGQMKTIGKSIPLKDVKEFIRLLKERCGCDSKRTIIIENGDLNKIINKLAGDK